MSSESQELTLKSKDRFRKFVVECLQDDIFVNMQVDGKWLENLRLKCREYIKNNGTKSTTISELLDVLKDQAFKTFPNDIMMELIDDVCNGRDHTI